MLTYSITDPAGAVLSSVELDEEQSFILRPLLKKISKRFEHSRFSDELTASAAAFGYPDFESWSKMRTRQFLLAKAKSCLEAADSKRKDLAKGQQSIF
jgi:hypothetical protein